MPYILVRQKVEDYAKWRAAFDAHGATRKAGGGQGGYVLTNDDDANDVTVLLKWDTTENARKFAGSDDLREAMQRAGVVGRPEIAFLNEVAPASD